MNKAKTFKSKFKFGLSASKAKSGNCVNEAYNTLSLSQYRIWLDENWNKFSNYEKEVAENIEYCIREGNY